MTHRLRTDLTTSVSESDSSSSRFGKEYTRSEHEERRKAIETCATDLLLQYPHNARPARAESLLKESPQHRDALRQHWALSAPVRALCEYVTAHRHELQSAVREQMRSSDTRVGGRLDARRTQVRRLRTGHPTTVVYHEPSRIFATGPNHVMTHVIAQADLLARQAARLLPKDSTYAEVASGALRRLEEVRRIEVVTRAFGDVASSLRHPGPQALAQAARSRRRLYNLAAEALRFLQEVEEIREVAVRRLLQDTLLAPLNTWQAFELATAMAMGRALASQTDEPLKLLPVSTAPENGILQVGRYRLYWQSKTDLHEDPAPEPSERRREHILSAYGLSLGSDRPDVVVTDSEAERVVAVAEAKYYTGSDGWKDALRTASEQIVRYARGYTSSEGELPDLIGRSLISVWDLPYGLQPDEAAEAVVPAMVDFSGLQDRPLRQWARRAMQER